MLTLQSISDLLDKLGVKGHVKQDALAAFRTNLVSLEQLKSCITDQACRLQDGIIAVLFLQIILSLSSMLST